MSAASILRQTLRTARMRRGFDTALLWLPWMALATVLAWRLSGGIAATAVFAIAAAAVALFVGHRARALDTHWLVRQLDGQRTDMEDSADLLFAIPASMSGLERLQRARLQQRIETAAPPDLRPRWSTRALALGSGFAALAIVVILLWPTRQAASFDSVLSSVTGGRTTPTQTRLVQQQLQVTPPAYTRQPARREATLDAKAPQGTRLHWTLRFDPQPDAAELAFHDGRRTALARDGDDWHASHVLEKSTLYRIVLSDAPPLQPQRLHRLDAIPDHPPQLRVLEPDRSLSLLTPGQRNWSLAFEASDDYGIAAAAQLRITLAQGSGEDITFREQTMTLRGKGSATVKRYAQRLDLVALGLTAGDDLIVQLIVNDNRSPKPQAARSPSLILRWPSELGTETTGRKAWSRRRCLRTSAANARSSSTPRRC